MNKILITKFEIISFVIIGAVLEFGAKINPLFALLFVLFSQGLKLAMAKQKKRNKLFSMLRLAREYFVKFDFRGVIAFFVFLSILAGVMAIKYKLYKALILPALCLPLDLARFIYWEMYKTEKIIKSIEINFKEDVKLIENVGGILTVKSNIPLNDNHKLLFNIITTATATTIKNDINKRNIFYVSYKKGYNDRYSSMEKGSRERLEQILTDIKGSCPLFVSATCTKYQDIYIFQTKIKLKFFKRELEEIRAKLGVKKGSLEIKENGGNYEFIITKQEDKIYYLDDVIESIRKPLDMNLPFIVGVDPTNGKAVIADLTKLTHVCIGGMTNTGKSFTGNGFIESMEYWNYNNVVFFITDFKHSAMNKYRGLKNVHMLGDSESAQMEFYIKLLDELKRRQKLFEDVSFDYDVECRDIAQYNLIFKDSPLPYYVVVTDEINTPIQMGYKRKYTIEIDGESQEMDYKEIRTYFLTKSRSLGIHLVDIIQKATDDQYPKAWRVSIDGRIIHKMAEASEIKYLLENPDYYSYAMNQDQGYFCFKDEKGNIYKLRGCFMDGQHSKVMDAIKEIGYQKPTRAKTNLDKSDKPNIASSQ